MILVDVPVPVFVELVTGADWPEPVAGEAVTAGPAGLVLTSVRPGHRPRIVVETSDQPPDDEPLPPPPFAGADLVFDARVAIGSSVRILSSTAPPQPWTGGDECRATVFRVGTAELLELDAAELPDADGVEQWLILLGP